jgi:hypothetical protein
MYDTESKHKVNLVICVQQPVRNSIVSFVDLITAFSSAICVLVHKPSGTICEESCQL